MMTVGIDLSSQPKHTATCAIAWGKTVVVQEPQLGANDSSLIAAMNSGDKIGIDIPLGWPEHFVSAIGSHHSGQKWPKPHSDDGLYLRQTDRFVWARVGRRPLSVSSDKIAIPAMRAAWLLSQWSAKPIDRAGTGRIVEVYPAAALMRWGFSAGRYKGEAGREVRGALIDSFQARTRSWVMLDQSTRKRCLDSDDAFDAFVAALVARASAKALCEPIPAEHLDIARREGWIAVPLEGSLDHLMG